MDAAMWAHEQFWGAELGDIRRQRRLVEVAACIRDNPCGTLPRAVRDPAALKAVYRLLRSPRVTHPVVIQPHVAATREQCRAPGHCLLIEDSTALSFTQREAVQGMGPLTNETSQGFMVHTSLAARIQDWNGDDVPLVTLAGVFAQECWARKEPEGSRVQRKKEKRRQKRAGAVCSEAQRWGRSVPEAGPPPEGTQWTLVADRESDIFEVLVRCARHRWDWVLRACQARGTTSAQGDIFDVLAQAPVLGQFSLKLRKRKGVAARKARLEVCAVGTKLLPPKTLPAGHAPQATMLVEVREVDPPADVEEPIHWVLLTSWPCECFAQARRVVAAYACRWLIEEYHKALKSGTHIEDSQLSTRERIEALLGIHAVIAADLLQLKLLANTHPDQPIDPKLVEPAALEILERQFGLPACGWTNASTMRAIARMGGYLGRKHDGPPGWLSIWRGWLMLTFMLEGFHLALAQKRSG